MTIVWDERKRLQNIGKHRLDFADLDTSFFVDALISPAKLDRLKAVGAFGEGIIAVVYVGLGREAISIVSMRRASRKERRLYEQARS